VSRDRREDDGLLVNVPNTLPVLTPKVSRILLGILINASKGDASHEASGEDARE
jgi:hypothetical protein